MENKKIVCPKCGKELINNEKFCTGCGIKINKKRGFNKKKTMIIILISLLFIIILASFITLFIIKENNNNYIAECKNFESELETATENYIKTKNIELDTKKTSSISLENIKNKALTIDSKTYDCNGYVLIKPLSTYKAYVKCGNKYMTKGYNDKYIKNNKIYEIKSETKLDSENESSNTNNSTTNDSNDNKYTKYFSKKFPSITSINEDKVNKSLHNSQLLSELYYVLGSCVTENDNSYCRNDYVNRKINFLDTQEYKVNFVKSYISDNSGSISGILSGEFDGVSISKQMFNDYYNKIFGQQLSDSELKKYESQNNTDYIDCYSNDGMGQVFYSMVSPSDPVLKDGIYTLTIDLVDYTKADIGKLYGVYNNNSMNYIVVPRGSYNDQSILGKVYLKYKKTSSGNNVIVSLSR